MTKQNLEQAYKNFITDKDVNRLELMKERPNIFHALRLGHHEIRHSNFIAWLLDPNETHGLGDLFFKRFLREVVDVCTVDFDMIDIEEINTEKVEIKRELYNIDILIETEELVVVIENKVHSKEHGQQLDSYLNKAESTYQKPKAYVYLTVAGEQPSNCQYAAMSYDIVETIIDDILTLFKAQITPSTQVYLNDYLHLLRNSIMKNGEEFDLAKKIYRNHRNLLDSIFAYRQDAASYIGDVFEAKAREQGWILGSKNNGFIRFTTKALDEIMPKRKSGWSKNESFLFEINLKHKRSTAITFYCTISNGDEEAVHILYKAISNNEIAYKDFPTWMTFINKLEKFKVEEWSYKDMDEIQKKINMLWDKLDIVAQVEAYEQKILANKNELKEIKDKPLNK